MNISPIEYALKFIGKPYIYASNGGDSFDCSGFVCEILKAFNYLKEDHSSQMLYSRFYKPELVGDIKAGSLLFFGRGLTTIRHVALAVNSAQMIEAGGGDSDTIHIRDARKTGAMVRLRPIFHRRDHLATLNIGLV